MEEQGQGSQQILAAVGKLNDITQRVKEGSAKMLEGSKGVIAESRNLELATGDITFSVNAMTDSVGQIHNAVQRVSEISSINKEYLKTLVEEVSRFKTQ
jgi:methyl-accepting chemotaxis protein